MKASFVLTLFALCLTAGDVYFPLLFVIFPERSWLSKIFKTNKQRFYFRYGRLGAVEFPRTRNTLSIRRHRDVLTAAFDGKYGQVSNPVSDDNTSHPHLKIDFGYKRTGAWSIAEYGVSIHECIQYCRNSDDCLAINFHNNPRNCYQLKTLGTVSADSGYSTCLVNYKNGDDPCNNVYWITGHGRWNFVYKMYLSDKTPTPKDCCVKCREDPQSRCKGWTYYTTSKTCYLQDEAPTLVTSSPWITGFGVVHSP